MNRKKAIYVGLVVAIAIIATIPASSMKMETLSDNPKKVMHLVMKDTVELEKMPMTFSPVTMTTDIPVITSDYDVQNPAITTDGAGNLLVVGEVTPSLLESDLGFRFSKDGGNTWYPEDGAFIWSVEETIETQPRIDYTGANDFQAYGTNLPDPSTTILHLFHFPNIADPEAVWGDDNGWTMWSLDLSGYYENYDGIDVAGYPYGEEIAPYPNFHGIIAATCIDSDTGLDTISLVYETEGTSVQLLYLPEVEGKMSGMTCDIDLSTGEYFEAWEWKNESGIINDGVYLDHCYLEPGNPDWWKGDWQSFVFEGAHNPDVKADGGNCYLVYEILDPTYGTTDIVCAYSHDNGETFKTSKITETPLENERFPSVTAVGKTVMCTYIKNGNLYASISEDGGITWEECKEPLNDESGSVVNADIANQYVTWTDNRSGSNAVYFDTIEVPMAILSIESISGGLGVKATVSNTGTATAENVPWSIDVTGGLVLVGKHAEGTISSLGAGESTTISDFLLGIGKVTVTVKAGGASAQASGFLLGPLLLGLE